MHAKLLQSCPTLCNPTDCNPPGSSVHGILPEYWGGLPFPPPGDLPHPGIKPESPVSPALQTDSLPAEPSGKPLSCLGGTQLLLLWLYSSSLTKENSRAGCVASPQFLRLDDPTTHSPCSTVPHLPPDCSPPAAPGLSSSHANCLLPHTHPLHPSGFGSVPELFLPQTMVSLHCLLDISHPPPASQFRLFALKGRL